MFILQTTDSRFANHRYSFRNLQIFISQTTDFHFVSFHFVSSGFVSQSTVSGKSSVRLGRDADDFQLISISSFPSDTNSGA